MPTVLLTRAPEDNKLLADALLRLGVLTVALPTPSLVPVSPAHAFTQWQTTVHAADAVAFTSRYAIRALAELELLSPILSHPRVAVVGPRTAAELAVHGVQAHLAAAPASGAGLAATLGAILPAGATVLCPQARHARPELADGLRAGGLIASTVVCYSNVPPPRPDATALAAARTADAVYFAAPSAADRLYAWLPELVHLPWIAIGPTTAAAVSSRHGHAPVAVAQTPRLADVAAALHAAVAPLGVQP